MNECIPDQWRDTAKNLKTPKVLNTVRVIANYTKDSQHKGSDQ